MSEVYTPSTVEAMTAWVDMRCGYDSDTTRREARSEFRRWLAAHDAQIQADTWEEGRIAEHDEANGWGDAINPYRKEQKQ